MRVSQKQLREDIGQDKLRPVYFFHGPEEFRKEQDVSDIIERLAPPGLRDFNLDILYGDEVEWADISDRIQTLPMMTRRRVVVVRKIDDLSLSGKEGLLAGVKQAPDHACLLLTAPEVDVRRGFYRELAAAVATVRFDFPDEKELAGWIQERARIHGAAISPEAIRLLADSMGNNLMAVENEIHKLSLYVSRGQEITSGDVQAVVDPLRSHTVFELCDAVGRKNLAAAMALLAQLLEAGMSPFQIMGMLRWHLSRLTSVWAMSRRGQKIGGMARTLGLWKGHLQDFIPQVQHWDENHLEQAFEQLHRTELGLKTGTLKTRTAMTWLVYRLCRPQDGTGDD